MAQRSGAMTTAILLAVAATDEQAPACTLQCAGEPVLARFEAQLRRQGVCDVHVLTQPAWQDAVRAVSSGALVHPVDDLTDILTTIEKVLEQGHGHVLLAHAEIVTLDSVIAGLLADPRVPNGVLSTSQGAATPHLPRIRIERGRVVSAESAYHAVSRPTHAFLGISKISDKHRGELADVARELSGLVVNGVPPGWEHELNRKVTRWGQRFYTDRVYSPVAEGDNARGERLPFGRAATRLLADQLQQLGREEAWFPDPKVLHAQLARQFDAEVVRPAEALRLDAVALLVTGIVRRDVVLTSTYLRELFLDRPNMPERARAAARAIESIDEDRHLLNSAVKAKDGFFTTFFVSPYSKYIARWCARRGFTPNQVTTVSMLLGLLAALAFAAGTRAGLVAGALLLQVAFTADCVDGQLARYTRQFSKLGAWLDSVFDRAKEYVVYAGLAFGAAPAGADATIWVLAGAALTLQAVRHYLDFSYAAQLHHNLARSARRPLERTGPVEVVETDVTGGESALGTVGRAGVRLSGRFERRPWMKWAKRMLVLPIGERFALISLTAALGNARTTFIALLIWGAVAGAYSLTGRVLRSFA